MMDRSKQIRNKVLDGLLDLSNEDANIAKDLLTNNGIDSIGALKTSLNNIEKYKMELRSRVSKESQSNKLTQLLDRLKYLLGNNATLFKEYLDSVSIIPDRKYAFKSNKKASTEKMIDIEKLNKIILKLEKEEKEE